MVQNRRLYSLISCLELEYLVEKFTLKCPFRCYSKIQVLSGPENVPSFLVKINKPKSQRLLFGHDHESERNLDDDTTNCFNKSKGQHLLLGNCSKSEHTLDDYTTKCLR